MQSAISVIMPFKNSERTISTAVKSALYAMREDDELLLYDDCSNDKSLEIVRSIKDKRIRVYEGVKTLGPEPASNLMVLHAKSELISRFDSDDIALPNRFSESMREKVLTNYDFVFSNMLVFGRGWMVPQPPRSFEGRDLHRHLVHGNQLNNSSMMGKKSVFLEHGGYGDGVGGDKSLWLRLALADVEMKLLRHFSVLYRVHEKQITKSGRSVNQDLSRLESELAMKLGISEH